MKRRGVVNLMIKNVTCTPLQISFGEQIKRGEKHEHVARIRNTSFFCIKTWRRVVKPGRGVSFINLYFDMGSFHKHKTVQKVPV